VSPKHPLRQFLVEHGLVAEADLAALEEWPAYRGASLAERLYRSGIVSDQQLVAAFISLGATDGTADLVHGQPPPAALGAFSRTLAEKHRAIALQVERSRIVVAMLDPSDTEAIEKLSWFASLAVEPRAARPRILFNALADAYGIAFVRPDGAFLASRGIVREPPPTDQGADEADAVLPAPSPDTPHRVFGAPPAEADPHESPLAKSLVAFAGASIIEDAAPQNALHLERLVDMAPARSPDVLDDAALTAIARALPPGSPLEARDSLPPQVLRLLTPPMRCAMLFLVRGSVAVGWDGRAHTGGGNDVTRDSIRDVLLPLTGPSAFQRALTWQRVAVGTPTDPTIIELILWQHLKLAAPSSFAVLPIVVGEKARALLYIDRGEGMLDDTHVDAARRVGNTLADGLAPFVAANQLFPEAPKELPTKLTLRT
jgi:hypothetical protein